MPEEFKTGELRGIWLYTWAKLGSLRWDEDGFTADVTSDRDQTLTLRIRRPVKSFTVNGEALTLDGDHVDVEFRKGEKMEITARF